MGQIKNIKLHIVTDIKVVEFTNMAAEAFVSLTTNDDYGNGAYVLGKSLRNSNTTRQLVLMVTSGVSDAMRMRLNEVRDLLVNIDQLDSFDNTYNALVEHAKQFGSFDGGDQGLLNEFFPEWNRVPFTYNTVSTAVYSYTPAFNRYGKNIKIVHFLGAVKPWHHYYDQTTGRVRTTGGGSKTDEIFTQMWWELNVKTDAGVDTWSKWASAREYSPTRSRTQWEEGRPDYEGQDRFDNIMTYMSAMMLSSQPASANPELQ